MEISSINNYLTLEELPQLPPLFVSRHREIIYSTLIHTSPLFKGVSDERKITACAELERVSRDPSTQENTKTLIALFAEGGQDLFFHEIFSHPDIHHLLLITHFNDYLTTEQLGTAYFFFPPLSDMKAQ